MSPITDILWDFWVLLPQNPKPKTHGGSFLEFFFSKFSCQDIQNGLKYSEEYFRKKCRNVCVYVCAGF